MKKRVSRNIRIGRFLMVPYMGGLVLFGAYAFFISDDKLDTISIILIPIISLFISVIGYFIYKYLDKAKTIEYDDSHLYISDKFGVDIVPLENIISLKMTTTQLNNNFGWKITYKPNTNTERHATFFSRPLNVNMEEFGNMIKNKNLHAKIQKLNFGPFEIDRAAN